MIDVWDSETFQVYIYIIYTHINAQIHTLFSFIIIYFKTGSFLNSFQKSWNTDIFITDTGCIFLFEFIKSDLYNA